MCLATRCDRRGNGGTGDVVKETFDVVVPSDALPGRYTWRVGWYDVRHPNAALTDERSRMAGTDEHPVAMVEVEQ